MTGIAPFTQNSIQVGLKLPRDYNDESLRHLKEKWDRQHGPLSDRQMTPMGKLTNS
jgi:hypothetical protein